MKKDRIGRVLPLACGQGRFAKVCVCVLAASMALLLMACSGGGGSERQGSSASTDVQALEANDAPAADAADSGEPPEYVETEDLAQYDDESFCVVLRNGQPATEENVSTLLASLENKYPDGAQSEDCGITAALFVEEVFGERASCMIESDPSLEDFRPGDEMHYSSDEIPAHNVVVIDRVYEQDENGDEVFVGLKVAEGNYLDDMKYRWGRVIKQSEVDAGTLTPKMRNYYY